MFQNSLTCWGWGDPGYCGPNAIVRPGDNINFSFGTTDLYQTHAIASVLPSSGSGLRVNGYNFGFTAKNGNGWDDGRVDYLVAYTRFTDSNGNVLYDKNYNLNYQFNWTTFNFSENFTTPFATKDLGNVTYGFVGRDNNFWAGPYGPEVYNVSFSLKYSVDPCFVNVLSSPSCPGYLDELAKLQTTVAPVTTIAEPISATTSTAEVSTPSQTATSTPTTAAVSATPSTPVAAVSNTPAPGGTTNSSNTPGVSLSTVLGIIRNEQSRLSSVESAAVQQANEAASQAATQAQERAENVAARAVAQSQSITSQTSVTASIGTQASTLALSLPGTGSQVGLSIGPQILRGPQTDPNTSSGIGSQEGIPLRESLQLTGRSPIKDYLDEKPVSYNESERGTGSNQQVKKPAQNNELAGESTVNIAAMNKLPPGYELYMIGMKDTAFYQPKEIYKNQKVIDNQRVLRQLNGRSDQLHQRMIDQQYELRN